MTRTLPPARTPGSSSWLPKPSSRWEVQTLLHLQTHTILLHAIYNVRTESWTSVVRLLTNFYLRVPFELGSLCVVRCWRQPICTYCGLVSCAAALGPTCCWSFP